MILTFFTTKIFNSIKWMKWLKTICLRCITQFHATIKHETAGSFLTRTTARSSGSKSSWWSHPWEAQTCITKCVTEYSANHKARLHICLELGKYRRWVETLSDRKARPPGRRDGLNLGVELHPALACMRGRACVFCVWFCLSSSLDALLARVCECADTLMSASENAFSAL